MSTRLNRRYVPLSGNYTIKPPADSAGTIFTNRDATGAITITLPTPTRALLGFQYYIKGVVDQSVTVQTATAGTLVALNGTTFSSIAFSTAGQKIGAQIELTCIETANGTFRWAALG